MLTRREFLVRSSIATAPLLALARCGAKRRPGSSTPNILLVVLDTVRADHVGCYGAPRPTTPAIDQFAQSASRYTRALAPAPWTVPTHASMFTGKYPFMHGAYAHKVAVPGKRPEAKVRPLSEKEMTVAELLQPEGYATGSVCANTNFKGRQLLQGFDDPYIHHMYAAEANQSIFAWLRDKARPPFFFFINYVDAHRPYNTKDVPGLIGGPVSQDKHLIVDLMQQVLGADGPVSEGLIRRVIDQYDTGIRNVDTGAGALLEELVRLGMYDDTLIIVTSDHGECFGEHRLAEHGLDLYQSEIHVPLLIKTPGQKVSRVVDAPISLTHTPRVILEALPPSIADRHLASFPFAPGDPFLFCENQLMGDRKREFNAGVYGDRFDRQRTAVVEWPLKYIESTKDGPELLDLSKDPRELHNLVPDSPHLAARLAAVLHGFVVKHGPVSDRGGTAGEEVDRNLTEEDKQDLRALGYF